MADAPCALTAELLAADAADLASAAGTALEPGVLSGFEACPTLLQYMDDVLAVELEEVCVQFAASARA